MKHALDIQAITLYHFYGEKFDGAIHPFTDSFWGTNVCTSFTGEPFLLQDARLFLHVRRPPLTPVCYGFGWGLGLGLGDLDGFRL